MLKAILLVPLLLGGAIALSLLSYMVVPIAIISFVLLIAFTLNDTNIKRKKRNEKKHSKKIKKMRKKSQRRRTLLGY